MEDSVTSQPTTPMLSVAVNEVIGTVNEVDAGGIANPVTVGGVESGSVMVVAALMLVETLPAASLAHAYSILAPGVEKE